MRKIDTYGLKSCNFQAELFQKSLNETTCSSKIFIRRFMLSDLAKRMDSEGFLFDAIDVTDALCEIDEIARGVAILRKIRERHLS